MSAANARRLLLLLAALTAVLLACTSPALAATGAQNRVGAFNQAASTPARDLAAGSSCTHQGSILPSARSASGFCVATEDTAVANPLADATYSQKVLDQMAQGDYHGFPASVDGFANESHVTTELGADGSPYTHVRIPGGDGSNEGVFHYIFGDNGVVTYRLFEPGS
jgi:hypothetical protein